MLCGRRSWLQDHDKSFRPASFLPEVFRLSFQSSFLKIRRLRFRLLPVIFSFTVTAFHFFSIEDFDFSHCCSNSTFYLFTILSFSRSRIFGFCSICGYLVDKWVFKIASEGERERGKPPCPSCEAGRAGKGYIKIAPSVGRSVGRIRAVNRDTAPRENTEYPHALRRRYSTTLF